MCLEIVKQASADMNSIVLGLDSTMVGTEQAFQAIPNTNVQFAPSRNRWLMFNRIITLLKEERPDAIMIYTFGVNHLLIAFAARLTGVSPVLVTAQNTPPKGHGRWKWKVIVILSRLMQVPIQSCSRAVQDELLDLGVGLPGGSDVIHNGCDVSDIYLSADDARKLNTKNPGPFVIGMVARLDRIKDQPTLIRAFAKLVSTNPERPVELWLVGDGDLHNELKQLVGELGITDRVRFLGTRDDIPELLGQIDIFAFSTTRAEGFGIALIEAMAAGLPVIASDVPACREVLQDGEGGILVPAGSVDKWSEELQQCMNNPSLRSRLANQARLLAETRYSTRACYQKWMAALGI